MQHILRIIRISSEKGFKLLKEKAPYKCSELNKNINVTNIFLKHISGYKKSRKMKEIIIRLGMINLIDDILLNGKVIEIRKNVKYEGKFFLKSYKISYELDGILFIVIFGEKKDNIFILLSCFTKKLAQKKITEFNSLAVT